MSEQYNHILMPSFYRGFFDFFGRGKFNAITISENTAWYLTFDALDDKGLRAHEEVHMAQHKQHGKVKFLILYSWYTLRYGYWNNPFEIEAREVSGYA